MKLFSPHHLSSPVRTSSERGQTNRNTENVFNFRTTNMSLQKQTKVLFSSHDRDVNGMVGWSQTLPKPLRNMRCKLRCVVTYNLKTWSISNKILIVVEIISRTPPEIFYRASNTGNVLTRALVSFFLICFRRKTCGGDDFVLALGQYHWVYFDVKPLARF